MNESYCFRAICKSVLTDVFTHESFLFKCVWLYSYSYFKSFGKMPSFSLGTYALKPRYCAKWRAYLWVDLLDHCCAFQSLKSL